MRKVLLSAVAVAGIALASQFAAATPAQAQPVATPYAGLIQPVQYYGDWRRHQRHEYYRWRRHEEWRHRHYAYRHRY